MTTDSLEYAGFWVRVGASLIDTVLVLCVTLPALIAVYGWAYFSMPQTGTVVGTADFLISWVAPAVAVVAFWLYKQATPGKEGPAPAASWTPGPGTRSPPGSPSAATWATSCPRSRWGWA